MFQVFHRWYDERMLVKRMLKRKDVAYLEKLDREWCDTYYRSHPPYTSAQWISRDPHVADNFWKTSHPSTYTNTLSGSPVLSRESLDTARNIMMDAARLRSTPPISTRMGWTYQTGCLNYAIPKDYDKFYPGTIVKADTY